MHYDPEWDHDYCIDPDEWVCYGNCRDCPHLRDCKDGRELVEAMRAIEKDTNRKDK